jgi:hypothetical protein
MKKKIGYGTCKLTGNHGKFVKSHLIPRALTRHSVRGNYFIVVVMAIDRQGENGRLGTMNNWSSEKEKTYSRDMMIGELLNSEDSDWFRADGERLFPFVSSLTPSQMTSGFES